jgi:hypothetical protein
VTMTWQSRLPSPLSTRGQRAPVHVAHYAVTVTLPALLTLRRHSQSASVVDTRDTVMPHLQSLSHQSEQILMSCIMYTCTIRVSTLLLRRHSDALLSQSRVSTTEVNCDGVVGKNRSLV